MTIDHPGLRTRRGLLYLGLFALCPLTNGIAQSPPVLGYAAAKNANPERLDVFKKGLTVVWKPLQAIDHTKPSEAVAETTLITESPNQMTQPS